MAIPVIGLFVYPNINPFHFSIPHIIFNIKIEDKRLFDLRIFFYRWPTRKNRTVYDDYP